MDKHGGTLDRWLELESYGNDLVKYLETAF